MNNQTLYIIGNGFDLHHGLDTKYSSFGLWLEKKSSDTYGYLIKYLYLPELDVDEPESLIDPLWSDLESAFANLDADELLNEFSDYAPNYASDDFKSGDYHTWQQMVGIVTEGLTKDLRSEFKSFISALKYHKEPEGGFLNIQSEARFLNFNYTDSLEKYYGVDPHNILHIHGKASNNDDLILGHGLDPEELKPKEPSPPENASEEELEEWHEYMADNYDYSYESAKSEALGYFASSLKNTEEVLKTHEDFFNSLNEVREVIVIGHSLSNVDKPYFKRVMSSVHPATQWVVSYRDDKESKHNRLLEMGLAENMFTLKQATEI